MGDTRLADIPGPHRARFDIPPVAAADLSVEFPVFEAPFACRARKVVTVAGAAVTGADTNTRHLNLINKGTDGAGVTELANRDYVAGTNSVKGDEENLYAPATYLALAVGTVLHIQSERIGTGQALPPIGGYVEFESQ